MTEISKKLHIFTQGRYQEKTHFLENVKKYFRQQKIYRYRPYLLCFLIDNSGSFHLRGHSLSNDVSLKSCKGFLKGLIYVKNPLKSNKGLEKMLTSVEIGWYKINSYNLVSTWGKFHHLSISGRLFSEERRRVESTPPDTDTEKKNKKNYPIQNRVNYMK